MQAELGIDERDDDVEPLPQGIPVARWVMAAALLSLNLLDVVTTKLILQAGGSEANPVMAPLVDHPYGAYALKLSMAVGVGFLLLKAPRSSRLADRAVLAAIGIYMLVIGWNTGLLISAARSGAF
jgi:Domain of unknown function (DUF5658)